MVIMPLYRMMHFLQYKIYNYVEYFVNHKYTHDFTILIVLQVSFD